MFYHSIEQKEECELRIAVICCDDRMVQVRDNLLKDFCTLGIVDLHDLEQYKEEIDVLVLPVKGVDNNGVIHSEKMSSEFWQSLKQDIKIFCGMRNTFLDALPYTVDYYMEDKEVIHDNAILTAEGVLNELIGCCPRSIYDICVDIIGYGNCGKVIYNMLNNLHVNARVIRRDCIEEGDFIKLENWIDCGDVIINTSIQKVMDGERMHAWKKKPIIIDIATPDVIETHCAKQLGIQVIKAGNLPGRYASISAGNIIAEYIRGQLNHER